MHSSRDHRVKNSSAFLLTIDDMAPRIQPSLIKNKVKRQEVAEKRKKAKNQLKLKQRLARAKEEASDPAAKKVGAITREIYPPLNSTTEKISGERSAYTRQLSRA